MVQGRQRVVSYKVHGIVAVPEDEWFIVRDTHEATFTQEEYDTLEGLLRRDTRAPDGARTVHLFSGFLKCGGCGKAMRRKPSQSNVYYVCRTYAEKSQDRCTRHAIREDRLESAVLAAVQAQVALLEDVSGLAERTGLPPDTQARGMEKLLKEKARELEKVRALSDGLYADWKSGDITREDFRRMKARFEEQEARLAAAIANLEEERRAGQGADSGEEIRAAFLEHKNIHQLSRALLTELVDTIYVHEGKKLTIDFRFADELVYHCPLNSCII
jgi:hypothetical protein